MRFFKVKANFNKENIKKISDLIKEGKVLVCPTDTVYGFVCNALNKKAVTKVFQIKKRPFNKSMGIFVQNIKMAKKFAKISEGQEKFLKNNKIMGVFEARSRAKKILAKGIVSGEGKIGIRIPNYKFINKLFENINFPLVQTSANISREADSTKIKKILNQFKKEKNLPDLVLDAGDLKPSRPSTVIDLTGQKPRTLRT